MVDSVAAVIFFTVVAGASEAFVARLSWEQVATSRATAVPVMLATGRPYGMWRDAAFRLARARGAVSRAGVDVVAFVGFQVPVYAAILWLAGASGAQMAAALSSATAFMLLLSRPYGLWLDGMRRVFGAEPGAGPRI